MTSLVPRFILGALDLTDYPFSIEFGSDLGNGENQVDMLASLLADGEIESLSRRSNRTITLPVMIEGTDRMALAEAEQALMAECDKQQNELTVEPGDDIGPATVFTTFAAQPTRTYDDDMEVAGFRRWTLTIRALPYGRSTTKVIDNAGTPPSTGAVVDSCESATGWTGWGAPYPAVDYPVTATVDSVIFTEGTGSIRMLGEVVSYYESTGTTASANLNKKTGLSISTGTGGYLSIAVRTEWSDGSLDQLWMQVDSTWTQVATLIATKYDAEGFVHYVWPVDAGLTVTGLAMVVTQRRVAYYADAPNVWYDDVELLTAATTDHQIIKQLDVQGSARTTASLHVAAPSDAVALGEILVATMPTPEVPSGFTPDGRRWITQGTTTADATALGGSYLTPDATYSTSTGKPIFDVPVGLLAPGPYRMVALVKAESSSLTFGVQAQLRVGSSDVGPLSAAEVSPTGLTTGWQFIPVGTCYLPPLPVQNADATTKVRLLFKGAKMADVYFIPSWQVGGRPVADFSIISCGTTTPASGGSSSNLWVDSPSLAQPQGGWWRGPTSDRANAQSAWPDAKKPGVHAFRPGPFTAVLVSTGAAGPTLTLEYFPGAAGMSPI